MTTQRPLRPRRPRLALLAATAVAAAGLTVVPTTLTTATGATTATAPVAAPVPAGTAAPATLSAAARRARATTTVRNGCLPSVPEPGSTEPVDICWTLFRPSSATRARKVPVLMHSHGWGGSRTTDPAAFGKFLQAGYGVLSFDQRGFGASGGKAHVENPRYEGQDVRRLVRLIARQPWVRKDAPGDPRLGAIGGSYGGGYQFLGAFELLRLRGKPVFDALAPEITWHDLTESLAPSLVVRTEWAAALSAAALPSQALPERVYKALLEGAALGTWPDGSVPGTEDLNTFFQANGPKWHVERGRRLDIPVLLGQGTTDTLFPLEQAIQNWREAITPRARRQSIFVAYNGGHVLPAVLPQGVSVSSDPCSEKLAGGSFSDLSLAFFDARLKRRAPRIGGFGKMHFATPASTCTTVTTAAADRVVALDEPVLSTTAAGVPLPVEVAQGPIRIAGNPYLTGSVTAAGVDSRAFYGLAVGTSPLDAKLVQNNVLPFATVSPLTGEQRRIPLPAVAVDVPAGQSLFLLASPVSDTFVGMSSRTPGAVVVQEARVHLPVVG